MGVAVSPMEGLSLPGSDSWFTKHPDLGSTYPFGTWFLHLQRIQQSSPRITIRIAQEMACFRHGMYVPPHPTPCPIYVEPLIPSGMGIRKWVFRMIWKAWRPCGSVYERERMKTTCIEVFAKEETIPHLALKTLLPLLQLLFFIMMRNRFLSFNLSGPVCT